MKHESGFQIIEITRKKSEVHPGDWQDGRYFIDLKETRSLLENHPSAGLKCFFDTLTRNGEQSILLQSVLPADEARYYRRGWTRKDNVIRIVDFDSHGSDSSTNGYLGPIADIPTYRYGIATYAVDFEGETLMFSGPAIRNIWSFRKTYWSNANFYLPLDNMPDEKIALFMVGLPINLMDDYHRMYAVIPREARLRKQAIT